MSRKNLGSRVHTLTLSDVVMWECYLVWRDRTHNTDNPTISDIVGLRNLIAVATHQDLDMLCLFWLRNEVVALRKREQNRRKIVHDPDC